MVHVLHPPGEHPPVLQFHLQHNTPHLLAINARYKTINFYGDNPKLHPIPVTELADLYVSPGFDDDVSIGEDEAVLLDKEAGAVAEGDRQPSESVRPRVLHNGFQYRPTLGEQARQSNELNTVK